MTTSIRQWEVTVTKSRNVKFNIEEGETKEDFYEWLKSPEGQKGLTEEFIGELKLSWVSNTTSLRDIELVEEEVNRWDFIGPDRY